MVILLITFLKETIRVTYLVLTLSYFKLTLSYVHAHSTGFVKNILQLLFNIYSKINIIYNPYNKKR